MPKMMGFIGFVAAWTLAILGYMKARTFVRERLRYVDGVHRSLIPLKIGVLAAVATAPVAWVLPGIATGTAFFFGAAVGLGVAAGRKDIKHRRYLRA